MPLPIAINSSTSAAMPASPTSLKDASLSKKDVSLAKSMARVKLNASRPIRQTSSENNPNSLERDPSNSKPVIARPASSTSISKRKTQALRPALGSSPTTPKRSTLTVTVNNAASSNSLSLPASNSNSNIMVPPSPIASASPNMRSFKLVTNGPVSMAALPSPVKRALTKKSPQDGSETSGGKKLLFSPNYDVEKATKSGTRSARHSPNVTPASKTRSLASPTASKARASISTQPKVAAYVPPVNSMDDDAFDPLVFIANLPPLTSLPRAHLPRLPTKTLDAPRITLALDLDETLVHCSITPIEKYELTFKVSFNATDYTVYVRMRPGLQEFLSAIAPMFEVIVFTASQQVYADRLLDIIDPSHTLIRHRIFRDSCVLVDGNFLKDLNVLDRDLNQCAIVDNSIQAFGFQVDNGIPIESWFEDEKDCELSKLLPLLTRLKDATDVRPIIREAFRLQELIDKVR